MKSRLYALALLTAGTLVSCAVKEETPANENEKAYLEAWIHTHHPDAGKAGMGIYILDDEPAGSGKAVELPCYARVTYTIRDLDGNISSTSDSTVAKQLGEYDKSYYYGPRVWSVHENSLNKGIEDMIVGMTEGSSREAVIPGWLQTYNRYDSEEEYLSKVKDNSPQIYSVKIIEVTDDIIQWQIDTMERYSAKYLDGVDSLFYGFYYKQLSAPVSDETLIFARFIIVYVVCMAMNNPITAVIQAIGKVKAYHVRVDSITLLSLPLTWCLFASGLPPYSVFYSMIGLKGYI